MLKTRIINRAIDPVPIIASPTVPFDFEQITVANASIGLTGTTYAPNGMPWTAVRAVLKLETAQIRYRVDTQGAPTASVGTILDVSGTLILDGIDTIRQFRAIRTGASSGVLDVGYERAASEKAGA